MRVTRFGYAILTALLLPLAASADESVDKSWDIEADGSVSIENIVGEIIIKAWDKNEVRLTGTLGDSVKELELSASASRISISVINRDQRNIDDSDLKLMVPAGVSLDASGVSANVEIGGMSNDKVAASSVSGDVEVQANSQWVSIESVSGNVEFRGETNRISAESVSGDVELSGIAGVIEATTVSGDMELAAGMIESGKFETVSGDITVDGEVSTDGRLTAESMSGDVTINLPGSQSGLFKAQSFSGRITSDFGEVSSSRHGPGSSLKSVVGNQSAEIRVESFSGNISLQQD